MDRLPTRLLPAGPRPVSTASLQALADPQGFVDHLQPARRTEWAVYAKPPFAGPQQVFDYVGRYTHRIAIANQRLLDIDDGYVRFRYKNYRAAPSESPQTMTLAATEFIRRLLCTGYPPAFTAGATTVYSAIGIAATTASGLS